jgi:hypothetical protein
MLCQLSYGGRAGATPLAATRLPHGPAGPAHRPPPAQVCRATGSVLTFRFDVLEVPVAKLSFLAGLGAGYILGAKAGRDRYEQIRRAYEQAKDDPRLQSLAGMAQARADDLLSSVRTRMGTEPPR